MPVYLMVMKPVEQTAQGDRPKYRVAAAGFRMNPDDKSLVQIKFDLEIDESLLTGVIDTQALIVVPGRMADNSSIRAGLERIVESP